MPFVLGGQKCPRPRSVVGFGVEKGPPGPQKLKKVTKFPPKIDVLGGETRGVEKVGFWAPPPEFLPPKQAWDPPEFDPPGPQKGPKICPARLKPGRGSLVKNDPSSMWGLSPPPGPGRFSRVPGATVSNTFWGFGGPGVGVGFWGSGVGFWGRVLGVRVSGPGSGSGGRILGSGGGHFWSGFGVDFRGGSGGRIRGSFLGSFLGGSFGGFLRFVSQTQSFGLPGPKFCIPENDCGVSWIRAISLRVFRKVPWLRGIGPLS
jgi:hypothetical protein